MTKLLARLLRHLVLTPFAISSSLLRLFYTRFRIALFHQRSEVFSVIGEMPSDKVPDRILAVVTHVVGPNMVKIPEDEAKRVSRLKLCLDSLVRSFGHCKLEIIINTFENYHLLDKLGTSALPPLQIRQHTCVDPMYIEFEVPEMFDSRRDDFDWFLFLEDDILVHDGFFVEKLHWFNELLADGQYLLLPHRYEINKGKKVYFDLRWNVGFIPFRWNRYAYFCASGIRFGECENAHAACYCLNRKQLDVFIRSGRKWKNRVVMVGPLESAATGSLYESFKILKPAPENLNFLEVEHLDTKFSSYLAEHDRGNILKVPSPITF